MLRTTYLIIPQGKLGFKENFPHLLGISHYSKSQIFVQKFNFDKPQHFHEFFTQIFFWQFSREIKVVNS